MRSSAATFSVYAGQKCSIETSPNNLGENPYTLVEMWFSKAEYPKPIAV